MRWYGLSYPKAAAHTLILVDRLNGTGALVLGFSGETTELGARLIVGSLLGGYRGPLVAQKGSRLVKRAFEWLSPLMGFTLIRSIGSWDHPETAGEARGHHDRCRAIDHEGDRLPGRAALVDITDQKHPVHQDATVPQITTQTET